MDPQVKEWIIQAEYDLGSANILFDGERYLHSLFFCHLALEKSLKGVILEKTQATPSKTHDLLLLAQKTTLEIPDYLIETIQSVSDTSVTCRYPSDLYEMEIMYTREIMASIIENVSLVISWLKQQIS